jgi:hypothetical protein
VGEAVERAVSRHRGQPLAEDRSHRQVAVMLGLSRNTVRRFARAETPEELLVNDWASRTPGILDEHEDYLR